MAMQKRSVVNSHSEATAEVSGIRNGRRAPELPARVGSRHGLFGHGSRRRALRRMSLLTVVTMLSNLLYSGVAFAQIVPDGHTQTYVATVGAVTDVTTQTIVGQSGLNSFTYFNVDTGSTVNMHVPTGASNLVNVITGGQRSFVDGTLNAFRDGRIGGNVYFLNPDGIVVGQQGTINVGALTLLTPTREFVDGFFGDGSGGMNGTAASLARVLDGSVPVDAAGLISVRGRVNTAGDVDVRAGDIGITGAVRTGMVFGEPQAGLGDAVNIGGAPVVIGAATEAGHIRIEAGGDVRHAGALHADGRDDVNAGRITITAEGNVLLDDGSVLSARGQGAASSAGDIVVLADDSAQFGAGAVIDARGGDVSGDGGFIELSAINTVRLGGGAFLASATNGQAGSILIDPDDLHIVDDQLTDGAALTLQAGDTITVGAGVTLSTRHIAGADHDTAASSGDSGDLTLEAPIITIGQGAKLLAHATDSHRAGEITLHAVFTHDAQVSQLEFPGATAVTKIDIAGATLKGGNITLTAASTANDTWDATSVRTFLDIHMEQLGLEADFGDTINNLKGLNIGAVLAKADASIVVGNGSRLEADGAVTLSAASTAVAKFAPTDIEQSALLGVVYGDVRSRADVDVRANAIIAANDLVLTALNEAELDLPVNAKDMENVPVAVAVAVGLAKVHSSAVVRQGAQLNVTDSIAIRAANESSFSLAAKAVSDEGGAVGIAASVLLAETSAAAGLHADAGNAGGRVGNVSVVALDSMTKNAVTAESSAEKKAAEGDGNGEGDGDGPGSIDEDEDSEETDDNPTAAGGEAFVAGMLAAQGNDEADKKVELDERSGSESSGMPEIAAAVSVVLSKHKANSQIGANTKVDSVGDVALIARVRDLGQRASAEATVGGGKSVNLSGAVVVGLVEHDAAALLGDGANVAAGRLGVSAAVQRTFDMDDYEWDGLGDVKTKLKDGEGIADMLSGSASSTGGGGDSGVGVTGSVLYIDVDSRARAQLGDAATVATSGVTGSWETVLHQGADEDNPDDKIDWRAAVAVAAETQVVGAFGAGNKSAVGEGDDASGIAIGGAYVQTNYTIVTEALVGRHARLNDSGGTPQSDVSVTALTTEHQYLIGHGTGGGAGIGINGNFAFTRTHSETTALIAEQASVSGANVTLQAADDVRAFIVAGGFNRPGKDNLSASVALQDVKAATDATVRGSLNANNLTVVALSSNRIISDVSEMSNSAAVGVSMVDVSTTALLASGSAVNVSDTVTVHAGNESSFVMTAKATAKDGAAAGIAGALLFAETDANASIATSLSGVTNVNVTALDAIKKTNIVAETEVEGQKDPTPGDGDTGGGNGEDGDDPAGPGEPEQPSTGTRLAAENLLQDKLSDDNLGDKTPEFDGDSGAADDQNVSESDTGGDKDGQGKQEGKSGLRLPKIGGAVSVSVNEHGARATIADGVQITATGDVAVIARVAQSQLHNRAETGVVSHGSEGEAPLSLSAAVVVGLYENKAVASIGRGSVVTAANVGVQSDITRTFAMEWHKWEGINTLIEKFKERKETQANLVEGYLSGFANSTAKQADGEYGLAGSVLYMDFVNRSEAFIEAAAITLTGAGEWSSPFGAGDDAETVEWDAPLSVTAAMDVHGAFAAGNIDIVLDWKEGNVGGGGGKVNLGASYAQVNHNYTTRAFVGEGVTVDHSGLGAAPDVSISALNNERLFVITPTAGTGATYGMSGNFALATVDSTTHAFIDEGADITAGDLTLTAEQNVLSFAIAGAVNIAEGAGVGIGVAVQRIYTDTQAGVRSGTGSAQTVVNVGSATIAARTDGVIETISVAGAAATQKDKSAAEPSEGDQEKKPGNKGLEEAKQQLMGGVKEVQDGVEQIKGMVDTAKELIEKGKTIYEIIDGFGDDADITQLLLALFDADVLDPGELDMDEFSQEDRAAAQKAIDELDDDMTGDDEPGPKQPDGAGGTTSSVGSTTSGSGLSGGPGGGVGLMNTAEDEGSAPKFGLGISGSVSVNVARLATEASVDGAVINLQGGADRLTTRAVNATDIGAFSGSASFVRAKQDSKGSAAVAGAAAVNDLQNKTAALLNGASVKGARSVTVEALASGDQLAIGIGAAVNASGNQNKAGSGAGSVSVSMAANEVTAHVGESLVQGNSGAPGAFTVTAYDRARLGTGGGSLIVGGKGGFGAAVTYSAIKNNAVATLSGSTVQHFGATNVRAFSAAQIGAGGAMVGVTNAQGSLTLGGAFVISQIHNNTSAEIVNSSLDRPGTLSIGARDVRRGAAEVAAMDALLDERGCVTDCEAAGHADIVDFDGAGARDWGDLKDPTGDESDDHDIRPRESLPGSSIIAVAGVAQGSLKGSNVGLAVTYSDIANDFKARLVDSDVLDAGAVTVKADTYATIMGFSVGVGIGRKFAGGGSLTHNMIRNETLAEVSLGQAASGRDYSLDAQSLAIGATDRSEILGVAGIINVSLNSSSAGFSLTGGVTLNETTARLQANDVTTAGALTVGADNEARIMAFGITGGVSKDTAIGGSVSLALIKNTASAEVISAEGAGAAGASIESGSVNVSARNKADIASLSGQVSVGFKGAAVGGAVVANVSLNDTQARIGDINVTSGGDVGAETENTSLIRTIAVSGSISGGPAAVGASINASHIQNKAVSSIASTGGHAVRSDTLTVDAKDKSTIHALAGQVSVSVKGAGVGVGLIYGGIMNEARATVRGLALNVAKRAGVHAANDADLLTIGISVAVGKAAGVGGSIGVSLVQNKTIAELVAGDSGPAPTVTVGSLIIEATDSATIRAFVGNAAGGGTAAVGAALGHAHTMNETRASLRGVNVSSSGAVSVLATAETTIEATAVGGGVAGKVAVTGSAISTLIKNKVIAEAVGDAGRTIAAASLAVKATDESGIQSLAGNFGGAGTAAVGGAFVNSIIMNEARARLADYGVTVSGGAAHVGATNKATIESASITAGVAGTAAVQGSFVNAMIMNETSATAAGANRTITGGSLRIDASDSSTISSLGGAVSGGGKAAIGAALLHNMIKNKTYADVTGYAINVSGDAVIQARNESTIENLTLAAALAGAASVAGALSSSEIFNETTATATAAPGVSLRAASLAVEALDRAIMETNSAEATVSGAVAIGGAVANNVIANAASAAVQGYAMNVSGATDVLARNTSNIRTIAAAAGGSGKASVQGSIASAHIHNTTAALVKDASASNENNDLQVRADDKAVIETIAGAGAVGGVAGAGGTAAVNTIGNTTKAGVTGSPSGTQYSVGNLIVRADSRAEIGSVAAAASGGIYVGLSGSVATNFIDNETDAFIDGGASIVAQNNVGVIAEGHDVITNLAGALGIAIKGAGVGASATVNMIGGHTRAYVDGANTSVTGLGIGAGIGELAAGAIDAIGLDDLFEIDLDAAVDDEDQFAWRPSLQDELIRHSVRGVAVNAAATHSIVNVVGTVGAGAAAGVAASLGMNVLAGQTEAYVRDADINAQYTALASAGQAADVRATDHAYNHAFVGSLGAGLGAGVAAGVNTAVFERTTRAYVRDSDNVRARGTMSVAATASQGSASIAVGFAAGAFGGVGTGNVGIFKGTTEAYVHGSDVDAGHLSVRADNTATLFVAAGGVALGGVAGAATAAIAVNDSTSRAFMRGSTVATTGDVAVDARNETTIDNWGASGAGGYLAGLAGTAIVTVTTNTTEAYVAQTNIGGSTARANSVSVSALDKVSVANRGGAVGVGLSGAGIGVAAMIMSVNGKTTADVRDAHVYARGGGVSVTALSERDLTITGASAGAGIVGLAGTVAIILSGTRVEGDAAAELKDKDDVLTHVSAFGSGDQFTTSGSDKNVELAGDFDQAKIDELNAKGRLDLQGALGTKQAADTSASVSGASLIDADGDIAVTADETVNVRLATVTAAGGLVAAGASVGVVSLGSSASADIGSGVSLISNEGDIEIAARTGRLHDGQRAVEADVYQGEGGFVALGAAVAYADTMNHIAVNIGSGASLQTLSATGAIDVTAEDNVDVRAQGVGLSVGAIAAGAVVALANKQGDVTIEIGSGATFAVGNGTGGTGGGNVTVVATRLGAVTAYTLAAKGGVLAAGTGSVAKATDNGGVATTVGDGVAIDAVHSDVRITATARPTVDAQAKGVTVSGVASIGVSLAEASAKTTVETMIGSGGLLRAGALTVRADLERSSGYTARSDALAASGGGLLGVNATASDATVDSTVQTAVHSDIEVSGDIEIIASNLSRQRATVDGFVVGAIALGANFADARATTVTRTTLGDVRVSGGPNWSADLGRDVDTLAASLTVLALADDDTQAAANSGGGGVVAGTAADATMVSKATVSTSVGGNGSVGPYVLAGNITVGADHSSLYGAGADTLQAAVAGMSGAFSEHVIKSDVTTNIGDNTRMLGFNANIYAASDVETVVDLDTKAAAGGLVNASAAFTYASITQDSHVTIGDDVKLTVVGPIVRDVPPGAFLPTVNSGLATLGLDEYGDPIVGDLRIRAVNRLRAVANASLQTGGLIDLPDSRADVRVNVTESVTVGDNALVFSTGHLFLEAYANVHAWTRSLSSTSGAASAAKGHAETLITARHAVTVGRDTELVSHRYLALAAGEDGLGQEIFVIMSQANTNVFNNTAIPAQTSPYANAEVNNASSVKIGAGARLRSVLDTRLIASDEGVEVLASGRGVTPYHQLLSTEINDSHTSRTVGGTLEILGDVRAGIWHRQEITIGRDPQRRITLGDTTVAPVIDWKTFNPYKEIEQLIAQLEAERDDADEERRQQIDEELAVLAIALQSEKDNNRSMDVVEIVSDVYAAGGNVVLHGSSIRGTGSVTAMGGPLIDVTNDADAYLVINELYIPERDTGGAIRFTGDATSSAVSGSLRGNLHQIDRQEQARIFISNTVSKGTVEPGIFLQGTVENLKGVVRVFNQSGNINQLMPIRSQVIQIEAPNGSYIVNMPGDLWSTGSPIGQFASWESLPGAASLAEIALSSYLYNETRGMSDSQYNEYLKDPRRYMRSSGRAWANGYTWVLSNLPSCYGKFDDCKKEAANASDYYGSSSNYVKLFADGDKGLWMRKVSMRVLDRTGTYASAGLTADDVGTVLAGGSIAIYAEYIDINGKIRSGRPSHREITIDESIQQWIADLGSNPGQSEYEVPERYYKDSVEDAYNSEWEKDGESRSVRLLYRPGEGIVVGAINAAGGGLVHLSGKIISTNPFGQIEVLGGVGHVTIDNPTDEQLIVTDIYTGSGAASEVRIFDKAKNVATWYVFEPGQGTTMYTADVNTRDYSGLTGQRLSPTEEIKYDPLQGQRFEWTRSASVSRSISWPKESLYNRYDFGSWYFTSGQTGEPWRTTQRIVTTGKVSDPDLLQTRSGTIGYQWINPKFSDENKKGIPMGNWGFRAVSSASLTIKTSVRADNPFKISFSGDNTGGIEVNSPAGMTLTGTLFNPTGHTQLVATPSGDVSGGAIRQVAAAVIISRSLTMQAQAGVGAYAGDGQFNNPIRVELGDGKLEARNDGQGDVIIDVVAGGVSQGELSTNGGDVALSAFGSILNTGLRGDAITLHSHQGALGSAAVPLRLQASGQVSAVAEDDIYLQQLGSAGDLQLVRALSTAGDVGIYVDGGLLLNAAEHDIDYARIEELGTIYDEWLTGDNFEENTIIPFQNRVNAAYEQYWRLRHPDPESGSEHKYAQFDAQGNLTRLTDEGLAAYRDRAQAAAESAAPEGAVIPELTDADVEAYVAGLNDEYMTLFDEVYGDEWRALAEFVAYDAPDFDEATGQYSNYYAYKVTDAQRETLEYGSVWTKNQLELRINENALIPVSDTQIVVQEANVRGQTVTLEANHNTSGGIGTLEEDVVIELPEDTNVQIELTDREKAALIGAALPGDITLQYDGDRLDEIRIRQMRSVYVDVAEALTVESGGHAYVVGEGNVYVRHVNAAGDILLAAGDSIVNVSVDGGPAIVGGGNLALEAGRGSLGAANNPLTFALMDTGYLSIARARETLNLQAIGGDLRFGGLYAGGDAFLIAGDGSIVGNVEGAAGARIDVRSLRIESAGDFRSALDEQLQIAVSARGVLTGAVGGDARLASPETALFVARLDVGGALQLGGRELTLTDAVNVGGQGEHAVDIAVDGLFRLLSGVRLQTTSAYGGAGGMRLAARRFVMEGADDERGTEMARIVAGTSGLSIVADADMTVGVLESAGDVTLRAGRAVTAGDAGTIMQLEDAYVATGAGGAPGSGTLTTASVGGQILLGRNRVGLFTATNEGSGDIQFNGVGGSLRIGDVTQTGGDVSIAGTDVVTVIGAVSTTTGDMALAASGVVADDEVSGGYLYLAGTASVSAGAAGGVQFRAAADVEMDAGATVSSESGSIRVAADGFVAMAGDVVSVDGDVSVQAGSDIDVAGLIRTSAVVDMQAGGYIAQATTGAVTGASLLTTDSVRGQTFLGLNEVQAFQALNRLNGVIELHNRSSNLLLTGITQRGELTVDGVRIVQRGDLTVDDVIATRSGFITFVAEADGGAAGAVHVQRSVSSGRAGAITIEGAGTVALDSVVQAQRGAISVTSGDSLSVGAAMRNDAHITLDAGTILSVLGEVDATTGAISMTAADMLEMAARVATTNTVTLQSGAAIVQRDGGFVGASLLSTRSVTGQTLTGANEVASFGAENSVSGDIRFVNVAPQLDIVGIVQQDGDVFVEQTGDVLVGGDVTARTGAVSIVAREGRQHVDAVVSTTGPGTLTLHADESVTLSGTVENESGAITVTALAGYVNAMGQLSSQTGAIDVHAGTDIVLSGTTTTTTDVTLRAGTSIVQMGLGRVTGAAALRTFSAGRQQLTGLNEVATWTAVNAGTGALALANTAATLTINGVTQQVGDVTVENVGNLTVAGHMTVASGAVTLLTTAATGGATAANQTILGLVRTGRGDVVIHAGAADAVGATGAPSSPEYVGAVTVGDNGALQTADGRVTVVAGDTVFVAGAAVASGDIDMTTQGDIAVSGHVTAGGDVGLTTGAGSIVMGEAGAMGVGAPGVGDVAATGRVTLHAEHGAIVQTNGRVTNARELWTRSAHGQTLTGNNAVQALWATNTADGDIALINTAATFNVLGVAQAVGSVRVSNVGVIQTTGSVTTVSGDIGLHATGGLYSDDVVTAGGLGSIRMTAGSDIVIGDDVSTTFGSITVDAGDALDVNARVTSNDGFISMQSGLDVTFAGTATTDDDIEVTAGGSVFNRSVADDAVLRGRDITLATGNAIGERERLMVVAAAGVLNAKAGQHIWLRNIGDVRSQYLESAAGDITLYVRSGRTNIERLAAVAGTVTVVGLDDIVVQQFVARRGDFTVQTTGRTVHVVDATVTEQWLAEADNVHVGRLLHDGDAPLHIRVFGKDGALADDVYMSGLSDVGVVFDRLDANLAHIAFMTDDLHFLDTLIGKTADLNNAHYRVIADNFERKLFDAHLQVHPRNDRFHVLFAADREILSNALDVNYDDDYIINKFHTENSFVRSTFKFPHVVIAFAQPDPLTVVRMPVPGLAAGAGIGAGIDSGIGAETVGAGIGHDGLPPLEFMGTSPDVPPLNMTPPHIETSTLPFDDEFETGQQVEDVSGANVAHNVHDDGPGEEHGGDEEQGDRRDANV